MTKLKQRLIFALVLVAIGIGWSYFYPLYQQYLSPQSLNTVLHINCPDLQQGCQFKIDDQSYQLKADQAIGGVKPFKLNLTGKAQSVRGSWQMQGMEMGPNEYRFLAHESHTWQAQMALPLCTASRTDWLLSLTVDQALVQISTSSKQP